MAFEKLSDGSVIVTGRASVEVARLIALACALRMEVNTGLRMSRSVSALAIVKREFNLRGSKARILQQFERLVEAAKQSPEVQ